MKLRIFLGILLTFPLAIQAQELPHALTPTDADPHARPPLLTAPPEEPLQPEPHLWDGNQTSVMAGVVYNSLDHPPAGLDRGALGFRVAARVSAITQFIDAELAFERASQEGAQGASLTRSEVAGQVGVHPGFPIIVFNDWFNDVISGVHFYLGLGLVRANLTGQAALLQAHVTDGSTEHAEWQPSMQAGVGADFPISPRNKSWGIWLTARYTLRWMWFGPHQPEVSLGDSQGVLLLGFRSNSTSWARFPRPF